MGRACDWVTWMVHRYAAGNALSALVLGCGEGWLDRALARSERIAQVVAVDFSEEALARAAERAAREGLSHKVRHVPADLNRPEPLGGPFDLVLAHDVIHHVRNLEGLFDRRQDPSEAVRSDEILPVLRARMKVLEEIPYGGSLLNPLLYEIVANFEDGNEADEAILRQLCASEKVLIRTGALPSDYTVVAATRKSELPASNLGP